MVRAGSDGHGSAIRAEAKAPAGDDVRSIHRRRALSRVLAARGFHLWDWIQADGEAFASLHLACGMSEEWPAPSAVLAMEAPEENHDDQ